MHGYAQVLQNFSGFEATEVFWHVLQFQDKLIPGDVEGGHVCSLPVAHSILYQTCSLFKPVNTC